MPVLTVRFIMSDDIVSKLIGWRTDSLWCHVEMLSLDEQHWIGAHAGTGVQVRSLDWCKVTRERRYALPCSPEHYEAAQNFMESMEGTPYNYEAIVGLLVCKRIGLTEHEVICSAFGLRTVWSAGYPRFLNVQTGFEELITPETMHLSGDLIGRCIYSFAG